MDGMPPPTKKIVTHCDTFHTDEAMAVAILNELYSPCYGHDVFRTRDEAVLAKARADPEVIVIDVGQEYNPEQNNYDHHQKSFTECFYPPEDPVEPTEADTSTGSKPSLNERFPSPMSSCGLIYKHFGKYLIQKQACDLCITDGITELSDESLEYVYHTFYRQFIYPIDAHDNGYTYADHTAYSPITLQTVIHSMNNRDVFDHETQLDDFNTSAVRYCELTLDACLTNTILRAARYVEEQEIYAKATTEGTPKELLDFGIIVLPEQIAIQGFLYKDDPEQTKYKLIVVPRGENFAIWTVRPNGQRFGSIVPLISQEEAQESYGDKVVFIHRALFTGAATDQDTAIAIAKDSITKAQASEQQSIDLSEPMLNQ